MYRNVVVNNADKIAEHFGVTQQHVIDIYQQSTIYAGQMWPQFIIGWVIVTVMTCVILAKVLEHDYNRAEGVLFGVGFVVVIGGLIMLIVAQAYIDAYPTVVEYNMYSNWVRSVVGV